MARQVIKCGVGPHFKTHQCWVCGLTVGTKDKVLVPMKRKWRAYHVQCKRRIDQQNKREE